MTIILLTIAFQMEFSCLFSMGNSQFLIGIFAFNLKKVITYECLAGRAINFISTTGSI